MCVCTHTCTYVYVYICMYIYVYMYVYCLEWRSERKHNYLKVITAHQHHHAGHDEEPNRSRSIGCKMSREETTHERERAHGSGMPTTAILLIPSGTVRSRTSGIASTYDSRVRRWRHQPQCTVEQARMHDRCVRAHWVSPKTFDSSETSLSKFSHPKKRPRVHSHI